MPSAGYSTTPLHKKLGLKEGFSIKLINAPDNYLSLIGEMADKLVFKNKATSNLKLVHFFTNSAKELETKLPQLKEQISKNGIIWVSWYKKSSGKATEVTEDMVRNTALAIGLVDVKVCAVDENWSGLKLVYRLKDR